MKRIIVLCLVFAVMVAVPVIANDYRAFEKPQLLDPLIYILKLRFPKEKPVGDWLISPQTGEVIRDYTGDHKVLLRPSGEFIVFRDGQQVFGGLWLNWPKFKQRGEEEVKR